MYHDKIDLRGDGLLSRKLSVLILDPDYRRRAVIGSSLDQTRHYIIPLNNLGEFDARLGTPDCVLLVDEGDAVIEVLRHFARLGLAPAVVPYAETVEPERVVQAVRNGAAHYLAYPFGRSAFERAVARQPDGASPHRREPCNGAAAGSETETATSRSILSPREIQVLRMVSQGGSSQKISDALGISRRTVEVHRANILNKMNARNSIDAVNIARQMRLI